MTDAEEALRESLLEAMTEAALGGHELGPWELVSQRYADGYEARCSLCGLTTWVGRIFQFLEDAG